jgi:uncharacterized protein YecE (DUF72 family)
MKAGGIYIGTSGWSYKSWAKSFYPPDLPVSRQLQFYTTRFPTVEINRTFYRLPTEETFENWYREASPGFVYSIKGSRAVTHFKRLRPGAKSLSLLLNRSRSLGEHRGPVLWQLPQTLKKDLERLTGFLRSLNRKTRHAIEFRDPSWIDKEVFKVLRRYRVTNVALSSPAMPMCLEITGDFVYVRFHGLRGGAAHNYTDRELRPWARFLRTCAAEGITGFAYFNNDMNTRAPFNALRLMELVGSSAVPPSSAPFPGGREVGQESTEEKIHHRDAEHAE